MPSDTAQVNDFLGMQLAQAKKLGKIHIVVGKDGSADKFKKYHIEYSEDGKNNWQTVPKSKIKVNEGSYQSQKMEKLQVKRTVKMSSI